MGPLTTPAGTAAIGKDIKKHFDFYELAGSFYVGANPDVLVYCPLARFGFIPSFFHLFANVVASVQHIKTR